MMERALNQPQFDITDFNRLNLDRRHLLSALLGAGGAAMLPIPLLAKVAEKYPTLRKQIDFYVAERKATGIACAIGKGTAAPDFVTGGRLDFNTNVAVDADSLFRIYSMTKPITGMAAMMLVEEGKIKLDQPIADFLPEFANMKVLTKPDTSMESVPAKTQITLRQLLTHTAGLGYTIISKGPIRQAYMDNGINPGLVTRLKIPGIETGVPAPSLKAFSENLAKLPLVYEPGTRWSYSVSLDLTGRLIEVISGMPFDTFLQTRMFDPLKMSSTFFQVPQSEIKRLTTNYFVMFGALVPADAGSNSIYLDKPNFPFGGGGLVSSARDYDRFLSMLAGGGKLDGKRVLKPETVQLAMSNLLPAGVSTKGTLAGGDHFGAGGRVGTGERAGFFGWGGAAGTMGFVQTKLNFRATGMIQYMPANAQDFQENFAKWALADVSKQAG